MDKAKQKLLRWEGHLAKLISYCKSLCHYGASKFYESCLPTSVSYMHLKSLHINPTVVRNTLLSGWS